MMRRFFTLAFFVAIGVYALFQARFVILGPRISVENPRPESLMDTGTLLVSGEARSVSYLTLDGRQIYTDREGRFEEKLIAHQGINIIKLEARDRFGRETQKLVRVVAN